MSDGKPIQFDDLIAIRKAAESIDEACQRIRKQIAEAVSDERLALVLKPLREQLAATAHTNAVLLDDMLAPIGTLGTEVHCWIQNWNETQKQIAQHLLAIDVEIQNSLDRAQDIGRLGWTVSLDMTIPDVANLAATEMEKNADAYMEAWYEYWDSDLRRIEKRLLNAGELASFNALITQCLASYRRKEYAITISSLVGILEREIRNLFPPEEFYDSKRISTFVNHWYLKLKAQKPKAIDTYMWMSVSAFISWFYESYGFLNNDQARIFRHGIQHGTQSPPDKRIESLRLFHAVDTMVVLQTER